MIINLSVVACLFCVVAVTVQATTFGRMEYVNIASVNGRPAICLGDDSNAVLSVGWVILSESYAKKTGVWGVELKEGASPLVLKSGECFPYGFIPEGYEQMSNFGGGEYPLKLEVNKTYVLRLNDAYQSTDAYKVVFCVNKTATGAVEYLQYARLPDGSQIVPVCDGKPSADASVPAGTGDVDK